MQVCSLHHTSQSGGGGGGEELAFVSGSVLQWAQLTHRPFSSSHVQVLHQSAQPGGGGGAAAAVSAAAAAASGAATHSSHPRHMPVASLQVNSEHQSAHGPAALKLSDWRSRTSGSQIMTHFR